MTSKPIESIYYKILLIRYKKKKKENTLIQMIQAVNSLQTSKNLLMRKITSDLAGTKNSKLIPKF